jgi:hypothetical protein
MNIYLNGELNSEKVILYFYMLKVMYSNFSIEKVFISVPSSSNKVSVFCDKDKIVDIKCFSKAIKLILNENEVNFEFFSAKNYSILQKQFVNLNHDIEFIVNDNYNEFFLWN